MRKFLVGALLAGAATFGAALPASAADDCAGSGSLGTPGCGGVIVEGGELEPTPQPVAPSPATPVATPSAPATRPMQATLPVTGSETATLALAGAALIGGGAVMVVRTRRTA